MGLNCTILKYSVPEIGPGEFTLDLPLGAVALTVQLQPGLGMRLWALVDPGAPTEKRVFQVFYTGEFFDPTGYAWLATVPLDDGRMVLHVFEKLR